MSEQYPNELSIEEREKKMEADAATKVEQEKSIMKMYATCVDMLRDHPGELAEKRLALGELIAKLAKLSSQL